jgi:hypothetical protein
MKRIFFLILAAGALAGNLKADDYRVIIINGKQYIVKASGDGSAEYGTQFDGTGISLADRIYPTDKQ